MEKKTEKQKEKSPEKGKGSVGTRGRVFEGTVVKKVHHRVAIEFERTVYVQKYERYYKKKTRIHARVPEGLEISVGDLVKARECRPLSKIIHFIVIEKVKDASEKETESKEEKK